MIPISRIAGAARQAAANFSARGTCSETGAIPDRQRTITAIATTFATMVIRAGMTAAMNTSKM